MDSVVAMEVWFLGLCGWWAWWGRVSTRISGLGWLEFDATLLTVVALVGTIAIVAVVVSFI